MILIRGESSSDLSVVLSEPEEKPSYYIEKKGKRAEEFHWVAAMVLEPPDKTKSEGTSIKDKQREDPELKLTIDFQEEGMLPGDDKKQENYY